MCKGTGPGWEASLLHDLAAGGEIPPEVLVPEVAQGERRHYGEGRDKKEEPRPADAARRVRLIRAALPGISVFWKPRPPRLSTSLVALTDAESLLASPAGQELSGYPIRPSLFFIQPSRKLSAKARSLGARELRSSSSGLTQARASCSNAAGSPRCPRRRAR